MAAVRVLIMGAAGRDFHNFNVFLGITLITEWLGLRQRRFPTLKDGFILQTLRGLVILMGSDLSGRRIGRDYPA